MARPWEPGRALRRDSGAGTPGPAWCQQHHQLAQVFGPSAEQGTSAHEMLRSFLNMSLGASPRTWEGGGRQRHDHPQPPLPSSQPAGLRCDAAGTRTCVSLLWAPEVKGLRLRVLHGNEHRSLRRVGKLMLSQGRVRLSTEVRSSPPQPAPQPLPRALCQLCRMEALAEEGWEPPGPLWQMRPMLVTPHCESPALA